MTPRVILTHKFMQTNTIAATQVKTYKTSEATRASAKEYHKANRDRILAKKRAYNKANRDRRRLYYESNKEVAKAQGLAYRWANIEAARRYGREHYKANPAKYKSHNRKRRAALVGSFTQQDVENLLSVQHGLCAGCRCCIKQKYEIDHVVPVSKGGCNSPDNLQLLCKPCNRKKRTMMPDEWAMLIGKLFV